MDAEHTNQRDNGAKIATVRSGLLAWFEANRRDLPWRRTRDPYQILLSEVMLQQTQVDRVIPYYERFLSNYPTVEALAGASTGAVIRDWAGLGYNRRAVNLQRTAQVVVAEHGGAFPGSVDGLLRLPGVGPYTAGAIACFAFEQDVAFLDTNMRRVIHRLFYGADVPATRVPERDLLHVATQLVPYGDAWRWNQALMEFGALHCTARRPACVVCPLQADCLAYPAIQGAIARLPTSRARKREGPFAGSNRYYRGRIVDALRGLPSSETHAGMDLLTLGARVRADFDPVEHLPWIAGLVGDLARDGLARVAEERAEYDATTADSELTPPVVTVRLP